MFQIGHELSCEREGREVQFNDQIKTYKSDVRRVRTRIERYTSNNCDVWVSIWIVLDGTISGKGCEDLTMTCFGMAHAFENAFRQCGQMWANGMGFGTFDGPLRSIAVPVVTFSEEDGLPSKERRPVGCENDLGSETDPDANSVHWRCIESSRLANPVGIRSGCSAPRSWSDGRRVFPLPDLDDRFFPSIFHSLSKVVLAWNPGRPRFWSFLSTSAEIQIWIERHDIDILFMKGVKREKNWCSEAYKSLPSDVEEGITGLEWKKIDTY